MSQNSYVTNSGKLNKGLLLIVFGWILVLYDPVSAQSLAVNSVNDLITLVFTGMGFVLDLLLALIGGVFWLFGTRSLASGLYFGNRSSTIEFAKSALVWVSLLLIPVMMLFAGAGLAFKMVALFFFSLMLSNALKKSTQSATRNSSVNNTSANNSYARHTNQSTRNNSTSKSSAPAELAIAPLSIHQHAQHLSQLVSGNVLVELDQLIEAINQLNNQSGFLKENHAYLHASVTELLVDLRENTVIRLDELAKTFVTHGMVAVEAQQHFQEKHQSTVQALIKEHLQEVKALNQTILEKKMAGFEQIGDSEERQFRESIMELRMVLKSLIAQAPDNSVSSHEVILNKLEETTLKQMQTVFFQPETSSQQKQDLQVQIDELLAHFKTQLSSIAQGFDANNDGLLMLTHEKNTPIQFSESQQFIDFNKQYVKQLTKHWH